MKHTTTSMARWGLTLALCMMADIADARGFFDPNQQYYLTQTEWQTRMAMLRVFLMAGSTITGFFVGWFFSDAAKEIRRVLAILAAIVIVLVALSNHGALGWSMAWLVAACGFFWGIGHWMGRGMRRLMEVPTTFGSAKWADADHLFEKNIFGTKGILLGTAFDGLQYQKICYGGDRHAFTYAPTRSGKGVSHIVPNLLEYPGSVLVIDVKGENLLITGKAREEMEQEVLAFDPWNIAAEEAGFTPARFNFLDWVQLSDPNAPENAMVLAESFIC